MSHSYQPGNRLIALLNRDEFGRLFAATKTVTLRKGEVLFEERGPIEYAYFPNTGVLSAVTVMVDGHMIEAGTIGNEGVAGLPCLATSNITLQSPNRVIVQVEGTALRISSELLRTEALGHTTLERLLVKYQIAFQFLVSRSAACNGIHSVHQRCCKWLLLTHDRQPGDELPLTHEFLSHMLAVRRPGVTACLGNLEEKGLVRGTRGAVTVLDRAGLEAESCECYRVVADEFARLLG